MSIKKRFLEAIEVANSIILTTHLHPDADGIGSQIALCLALRQIGKKAICVNQLSLMTRYQYLDKEKTIISYKEYTHQYKNQDIDLFIVLDTNSLTRIGDEFKAIVRKSKNLLFIDHHPCAKEIAAIHCIDTKKAATGELIGELIEGLPVKFTKDIALPLYTAILIDTSSFRYPTVTHSTHSMVAKLLKTGIKSSEAYVQLYGTKEISHIQLLGEILNTSSINSQTNIAWISLTEKQMKKYKTVLEDTHAFINHLLVLNNIKVVCMFRESGKFIKISFRSLGITNVGILAEALGGGGHNHSAATVIEGDLNKV
ncbi:MAG: bifunctional oligoribonuclease/PAP phosphatase NrnA, partial [Bdellovibrionales bacterium]|nr:bifunctional oligoribonuclease/PAP phosphatase NrnA [Bdellovibrionales bacterium]